LRSGLPLSPERGARLLLRASLQARQFRALWPKADGGDDHGRGPAEAADQGGGKDDGGKFFSSLKQVGGQKGSNEGGTFVDPSGQKWYVKNYKDPEQAAGEHVSNKVYEAVGARVPETVLGPNGRLASKWMEDAGPTLGQHGVDKQTADKILDHFAADVVTANWDTVGTGHDNILVDKHGGVTRVDQGGTLLHRAQGAPKPESALHGISEWNKLSDRNVNPYYAKVFKAAGLKDADALGARAVAQVAALDRARPSAGWKSFVERHAPNAPKGYAERAGKVLESRHALLRAKVAGLKALAEWDPAAHPRGPDGKFGAGSGGEKKPKAAHATKEQIAKAVELKKLGHSYAHIEKHTGLNPKQAATIVHKHNKAEAALKAKAAGLPAHGEKDNLGNVYNAKTNQWEGATAGGKADPYSHLDPMTKSVAKAGGTYYDPKTEQMVWGSASQAYNPKTGQIEYKPTAVGKHGIEHNAATGKYEIKDASGKVVASKFSETTAKEWAKEYDKGKEYDKKTGTFVAKGAAQTPYTPPPATGVNPKATAALPAQIVSHEPAGESAGHVLHSGVTNQSYTWQEKTAANSPGAKKENLGKFAYFDSTGKQVSAPFAKGEYEKAQATMHNGKGPDYKPPAAASYTGDQYHVTHDVGGAIGLGTGKWPISDSVERKMGTATHVELTKSGQAWATTLSKQEKSAVQGYTGSSYHGINSELYKGGSIAPGSSAAKIQSALDKAPSPPPPDLVWRGVSNQGAKQLVGKLAVGDKLRMDGFQSTSIKPEFANSWGGGHVVFEIKPSKGAYVQPISHHHSEYEYLLPHGASYRVHGLATVKLHGTTKSVVQLEMLQ